MGVGNNSSGLGEVAYLSIHGCTGRLRRLGSVRHACSAHRPAEERVLALLETVVPYHNHRLRLTSNNTSKLATTTSRCLPISVPLLLVIENPINLGLHAAMGLLYPAGIATAALTVVGACKRLIHLSNTTR
jgi:hypothetical protein